jgi:LysM repeat protein
MGNEKLLKQGSRTSISWLPVLGGCALSITVLCSLVLAVLLVASTAANVYLVWTLTGYEISISQPTSVSTALVLVTPTGMLAIIPTPTGVPTSTPVPTATAEPTSTSTSVPTEAPTSQPVPTVAQTTPQAEPASPTATGAQIPEPEKEAQERAGSSAGYIRAVAQGASGTASAPTPETIPYVVQEGDTLWLIAETAYSDGALWPVIFEANRDVLDDPDRIKPDQLLRVPLNP